jgi:hypothetical protein
VGVEAGMGPFGHRKDIPDGNVGRKQDIEPVEVTGVAQSHLGIQVDKLLFGVDTSVGPPAANRFGRMAQKGFEGPVQFGLHRRSIVLYLPAMIPGSAVSELNEVSQMNGLGTKMRQP